MVTALEDATAGNNRPKYLAGARHNQPPRIHWEKQGLVGGAKTMGTRGPTVQAFAMGDGHQLLTGQVVHT